MVRRHRDSDDKQGLKLGMSLLIVALMVFSAFAVLLGSSSDELKYNKFKFSRDPTYGYYVTKISNEEVYFYTFPTEVAYLNITNATIDKLRSAAVIITTFDPNLSNQSIQSIELARFDLAKFMTGKNILNSVTEPATGYESLPVLGCENATIGAPVIVFNVSDTSGAFVDGECLYLNGKGMDFLRFRDRIIYSYLGVI